MISIKFLAFCEAPPTKKPLIELRGLVIFLDFLMFSKSKTFKNYFFLPKMSSRQSSDKPKNDYFFLQIPKF